VARALPTLAGYGDVGTVVTASTGNHGAATRGQPAARARAVVFVPEQASATKLAHIERLGAEIRREGADMDEAKELGQAEATRRGVPFFEDGAEPAQYEGYEAIGDELSTSSAGRPRPSSSPSGTARSSAGSAARSRPARPRRSASASSRQQRP
jgi:threonine dehydratase